MLKDIYLSLGSNLGNRKENISLAEEFIEKELGNIVNRSSIYETTPWKFKSDHLFYNRVIHINSIKEANQVLVVSQNIEKQLGRTKKTNGERYESRIIDIDILFYGDQVISLPNLEVPHQKMQERLFELLPMAELCEGFVHPVLRKTIKELIDLCNDNGEVNKIT